MLLYAEHQANKKTAVFQSKRLAWNTARLFPYWMNINRELTGLIDLNVFNRSDSMLFGGHGILCRTKTFMEINGFVEEFATEDFATSLELIEQGYKVQAVNVASYELESETVQFHTVRLVRWARGTLETVISKTWNIPFSTKLRMFMGGYHYFQWIFYLFGIILIIWGYPVTWKQIRIVAFLYSHWGYTSRLIIPAVVILIYIVYAFFIRPLWIAKLTEVSLIDYFGHFLLSVSVGFYAVFHITVGQIDSLCGEKAKFIIGQKDWYRTTIWDIIKGMRWTMFTILVIFIGILKNPVASIIHFIWYFPLITSPSVLYCVQNANSKTNSKLCKDETTILNGFSD